MLSLKANGTAAVSGINVTMPCTMQKYSKLTAPCAGAILRPFIISSAADLQWYTCRLVTKNGNYGTRTARPIFIYFNGAWNWKRSLDFDIQGSYTAHLAAK